MISSFACSRVRSSMAARLERLQPLQRGRSRGPPASAVARADEHSSGRPPRERRRRAGHRRGRAVYLRLACAIRGTAPRGGQTARRGRRCRLRLLRRLGARPGRCANWRHIASAIRAIGPAGGAFILRGGAAIHRLAVIEIGGGVRAVAEHGAGATDRLGLRLLVEVREILLRLAAMAAGDRAVRQRDRAFEARVIDVALDLLGDDLRGRELGAEPGDPPFHIEIILHPLTGANLAHMGGRIEVRVCCSSTVAALLRAIDSAPSLAGSDRRAGLDRSAFTSAASSSCAAFAVPSSRNCEMIDLDCRADHAVAVRIGRVCKRPSTKTGLPFAP